MTFVDAKEMLLAKRDHSDTDADPVQFIERMDFVLSLDRNRSQVEENATAQIIFLSQVKFMVME